MMNVSELVRSTRKFTPMPWGWEEEIFAEDADYDLCVRTIFLKAGRATEVRAYSGVDMVIACASGHLALEWFVEQPANSFEYAVHMRSSIMRPNSAVLVEAATFHRLVAIEDTYLNVTSGFIDAECVDVLTGAPWSDQADLPSQ